MLKDWQTGKEVDDRSQFVISSLNEYADEQRFRQKFRKIILPQIINDAKERNKMNEELKEKIGGISKYTLKQIYQHVNFKNDEVIKRVNHEGIKDTTFLTYVSCVRGYLFFDKRSRKLSNLIYDYLDNLKSQKLVYLTPPEDKMVRKINIINRKRVHRKIKVDKNITNDKKVKFFNDLYNIDDIDILVKLYPRYLKSSLKTYKRFFTLLKENAHDLIRSNNYVNIKKYFADELIAYMKGEHNFDISSLDSQQEKDIEVLNENIEKVDKDIESPKCKFEDENSKQVESIMEYAIIDDRNHVFARNTSYDFILGAFTVFKLYESLSELKIVKFETLIRN